jgi:hypothetical protein
MKPKALLVFFAILVFGLMGCKKELVPPDIHSPYIINIKATPTNVSKGGLTSILCVAVDPDKNTLEYTWSAPAGLFYADTTDPETNNVGNPIFWRGPETSGVYTITVTVDDGTGGSATGSVDVPVGNYKLLEVLGQGVLEEPMGVYVEESSGKVWVADAFANKVFHYDGASWGSFSFAGVEIDTVIDTTKTPWDTLEVIDTLAFDTPMDVSLNGGLIYVLDSGANKLHKFTSPDPGGFAGSIISISGSGATYPPTGFVIVDDTFAYAACGLTGVRRINLISGSATNYVGPRGARDLAFNGTDRFWVTTNESQGRYFLKQYDKNYTLVSTVEDSIYRPWGIALAPSGNIFLSQWGDESDTTITPQCHVAEFMTDGSFVTRWGDTGDGRDEFNSPGGLWITQAGKIYVCDRGNGVVKVFGPN